MNIITRAYRIVVEAGQAGGVDEVERLARLGWPDSSPLTDDSPELREAIQRAARCELEAISDTSGT
jgi:hypothetical protein